MLRSALLLASLAPTLLTAASVDLATIAAMRLSDAPSYAWTTTVTDDARSYAKSGKHIREGYTWVTLPMIDSIARRLGRHANTDFEAIFASEACVIRLGDAWKTVRQLPKAPRGRDDLYVTVPSPGGFRTPDMPADHFANPDPFPQVIVLTPATSSDADDPNKPFCNARLAASAPHEELALIVSSWTNVVIEGDTVRGTLTDVGARLLLCPGSETETTPLAAAGEFLLQLKDNRVTRYQLKLEGVLALGKKKRVLVRQSSDTAIKDVGAAGFDVPAEARLALAR